MTALPPAVRRLVIGSAVSAIGNGLVLPLTLIYLHRVRHFALPTTGVLLAVPGVIGLIAVPLTGIAMDRFGARPVLAVAMMFSAAAQLALGFVVSPAWAGAVLIVQGLGQGPTFPAFNTALAELTTGHTQQRAFAINFTALNAGIGVGSLISGLIVSTARPLTFQSMFWANAAATVLASLVVLSISTPPTARHGEANERGSYRQVVAEPALRRAVGLTLLLALTGYAALDSGLPAYANVVAGVSARVVALSLSVNTLVIVCVQLPVLRLLRGRRRTSALAVVGVIWSASWVLFACCTLPSSHNARNAIVIAFAALFAVGETFMAPSIAPLINTLAPEQVRGRANALSSGTYSIAFIISPAISAAFIAAALSGIWIGLLAGGCLAATVVAMRLGRHLPRALDIAPVGDVS